MSAVPFIAISRFEPGLVEGFMSRVGSLVRNTQFASGPDVAECEQNLQSFTHSKHAIGCANGTDAIQLALRAAGVKAGDRVVIPDMTFWATFEAVVNVGAKPVTVDVDTETLHMSPTLLARAIAEHKPTAVILVHLYGWAASSTSEIRQMCKAAGLPLVEDCAQAFGTTLGGKSVIGTAEIATTSFYPAKVLGASGDAGAVFTTNDEWARKVRGLRDHGRASHYEHDQVGWNSRLGVYESAFLNVSIPHLKARIESRLKACEAYRSELKGLPLKIQSPRADVRENGYASVAIIDPQLRPALIETLRNEKIGFGTIYPGAMSRQPGAKGYLEATVGEGKADWVSKAVLNLPCFAYMRDDEIARVIDVVRAHFKA